MLREKMRLMGLERICGTLVFLSLVPVGIAGIFEMLTGWKIMIPTLIVMAVVVCISGTLAFVSASLRERENTVLRETPKWRKLLSLG
ncbi:MAG TPA: hypothetical protein ENF20_01565, partial [Candidatus Marinimicrobia bacterium]|nr:hypothetical protein [Candidatus Neomarinimicrobiota bacterium]